ILCVELLCLDSFYGTIHEGRSQGKQAGVEVNLPPDYPEEMRGGVVACTLYPSQRKRSPLRLTYKSIKGWLVVVTTYKYIAFRVQAPLPYLYSVPLLRAS